jgi:hypothetical protein
MLITLPHRDIAQTQVVVIPPHREDTRLQVDVFLLRLVEAQPQVVKIPPLGEDTQPQVVIYPPHRVIVQ